jgi:antitoxin component HigA of HigAB toxin-antitoxin module
LKYKNQAESVNMIFNPDKLANMPSLDEVEKELFSAEEAGEIRRAAEERSHVRRSMAEELSRVIVAYMSREQIGFNEFQRRLGMSTATASKLIKGEANITLDTIAAVAQLIGTTPTLQYTTNKRA